MLELEPGLRARLHVVVLAGGSGTRFWPLSRAARPKQVLDVTGEGTLLGQTLARVTELVPPARHWLVVGAAHAEACQEAAAAVPAAQVLVEPVGKNTAAAIALAALHVRRRDPTAVLIVLPADHHVADPPALRLALARAAALAALGPIVTVGVTPTRPETGYGYIQKGEVDGRVEGAFGVRRFVEKPALAEATAYVRAGDYVWNAGIFVMRIDTLSRELERQLPELTQALTTLSPRLATPGYEAALAATYARLAAVSIDYGIMEHAEAVGVVPTACGWSDVGSLAALGEVRLPDAAGNVLVGRAAALEACNVIVHAEAPGRAVVVLGCEELIVVDTPDATLVLPRARAQDVRKVVEMVKRRGWSELL